MKKQGVIVIGSVNIDMVAHVTRFPNPGETIMGKGFKMFPGGKGANQAVCCAKLGAKTFFIGKMGDDKFRAELSFSMRKNGVILDHLMIDDTLSTGIAAITVDDFGQNEIIVISGSNMNFSPDEILDKKKLFSEVKVVLSQLEIPLETVIKAAELSNKNKASFILNPAPARELPEELFPLIDFLTPNETELGHLTGKLVRNRETAESAARILLKKGAKNVVVTLGSKGALFVNNDFTEAYPARKVKVVDSTGAGDAFNGSLAWALSNGKKISEAINFANRAASISVTRMGAQKSMPGIEDIVEVASINSSFSKI